MLYFRVSSLHSNCIFRSLYSPTNIKQHYQQNPLPEHWTTWIIEQMGQSLLYPGIYPCPNSRVRARNLIRHWNKTNIYSSFFNPRCIIQHLDLLL